MKKKFQYKTKKKREEEENIAGAGLAHAISDDDDDLEEDSRTHVFGSRNAASHNTPQAAIAAVLDAQPRKKRKKKKGVTAGTAAPVAAQPAASTMKLDQSHGLQHARMASDRPGKPEACNPPMLAPRRLGPSSTQSPPQSPPASSPPVDDAATTPRPRVANAHDDAGNGQQRRRKRKKTRSKQKNITKDRRPMVRTWLDALERCYCYRRLLLLVAGAGIQRLGVDRYHPSCPTRCTSHMCWCRMHGHPVFTLAQRRIRVVCYR